MFESLSEITQPPTSENGVSHPRSLRLGNRFKLDKRILARAPGKNIVRVEHGFQVKRFLFALKIGNVHWVKEKCLMKHS